MDSSLEKVLNSFLKVFHYREDASLGEMSQLILENTGYEETYMLPEDPTCLFNLIRFLEEFERYHPLTEEQREYVLKFYNREVCDSEDC